MITDDHRWIVMNRDEIGWNEMKRDETGWNRMKWDEMKWRWFFGFFVSWSETGWILVRNDEMICDESQWNAMKYSPLFKRNAVIHRESHRPAPRMPYYGDHPWVTPTAGFVIPPAHCVFVCSIGFPYTETWSKCLPYMVSRYTVRPFALSFLHLLHHLGFWYVFRFLCIHFQMYLWSILVTLCMHINPS